MKNSKRCIVLLLAVVMILSCAACGGNTASSTPVASAPTAAQPAGSNAAAPAPEAAEVVWPDDDMAFFVKGSAGSGMDLTVRLVTKYMEQITGKSVAVDTNSVPSPVTYAQLLNEGPNGHAFINVMLPNTYSLAAYSDEAGFWVLRDYELICNVGSDPGLFGVRPDDARFTDVETMEDFIQYAKDHPDEQLLLGATIAGGSDDMTYRLLKKWYEKNDQFPENLVIVNTQGGAANVSSFLGASVDAIFSSVSTAKTMINDGTIKVLCVFDQERSKYLPDESTSFEQGIEVESKIMRGIAMLPGTDSGVIEKVCALMDQICTSSEFQADMDNIGAQVDYLPREEYIKAVEAKEPVLKELYNLQ